MGTPSPTGAVSVPDSRQGWTAALKMVLDTSQAQEPFERLDQQTYELLEAGGTTEVSQAMDECANGACPVR